MIISVSQYEDSESLGFSFSILEPLLQLRGVTVLVRGFLSAADWFNAADSN